MIVSRKDEDFIYEDVSLISILATICISVILIYLLIPKLRHANIYEVAIFVLVIIVALFSILNKIYLKFKPRMIFKMDKDGLYIIKHKKVIPWNLLVNYEQFTAFSLDFIFSGIGMQDNNIRFITPHGNIEVKNLNCGIQEILTTIKKYKK